MDNLKEWLFSVCAFTIASSVLYLFLPHDRISGTVKTVLRFVLLSLIFLPLSYSDFSIDMLPDDIFSPDEKVLDVRSSIDYSLLITETEAVVCAQSEAILNMYYSGEYEIIAETDILSDNCIHIKQIRIMLLSEPENLSELQNALESYFPTCEIIIRQEVKNNVE